MTSTLPSAHGQDTDFEAACEEAFCRLIAQRTGIVLQDHQLHNLRDTAHRGCERFGYGDCAHYLHELQQSQGLTAQLEYLIAGITVGESYFFRDSEQIELLRNTLLPEMIAAKRASGDLSLRVWSAGCSEGQEIYTLALLLHELIPDIKKWRIHLRGTDINSEVVSRAIAGRYSEWSFRATPQTVRERWFVPAGNAYEIRPEIRQMVHFSYLNLAADIYPSILSETNALDLILCRNVFIYLDRETVQRCMSQYADCLLDQGVLMLGASDPMYHRHTGLELVQTKYVGYFHKGGVQGLSGDGRVAQANPFAQAIADHQVRRPVSQTQLPASEHSLQPDMAGIITLLKRSDWAAALVQLDKVCQPGSESSDLWQMKAKVLANMGRAELALQACERSLQLDAVNKHSYLMQGMILAELDRGPEAEEAFRRTLYLDRSFLEAHYELAMLRVRARDLPGALKSLANALKIAQAGDPQRELHNAAGMTYQRFAQVLQNEIEMLRDAK
ncbi:MAG: CheR family methyltransferase [Gallionella sp.]|nr:CheR family methyltransferase [Gallionella sp.]